MRAVVNRGTLDADGHPADRIVTAYNLVAGILWVVAVPASASAGWMVAVHLVGAGLTVLGERGSRSRSPAMCAFRDLYPLAWLPVFWVEIGILVPLLHATMNDGTIAGLDRAVFGTHLSTVWLPAMPWPWLQCAMYFVYVLYLPLIYLPALAMAVGGRWDAVRDTAFRLILTYIGCYVLYLVFPVVGPREYLGTPGGWAGGFFQHLAELARVGDSRGTAFPSSHCAGAVTTAVIARRWLSRGVARLLVLQAIAVVLSTVYTQNHYGIDAVAGVALALVLQGPIARMLAMKRHASPVLTFRTQDHPSIPHYCLDRSVG